MIDDARVAFEIKHLRDTPERQVELVQSVFKEALDDKRKLLKIKNILFGNSDATEDKLEAEDNLEADDKLETEEKLEIEEHQL